jgi:hypothetical protein
VPASRYPRTNTRDVEVGSRKGDVPRPNLDPLCERPQEQRCNRVSPERRLNREDEALRDGLLEKAFTFLPSGYVGFAFRNVGVR